MKTRVLRSMLFVVMMLAVLLGLSTAQAQTTNTWIQPDGGTYNWSDGANWQDNNIANGTDVTALFNVTPGADQTATLDTAVTLGGLSLDWSNRNLTIDGAETLTLDVTSGTPTIDVTSGRWITISSQISGTDGLRKDGAGGLLLDSDGNDFAGGVIINAGRLNATSDADLDPIRKAFRMGSSVFRVRSSGAVEFLISCCRWSPAGRVPRWACLWPDFDAPVL